MKKVRLILAAGACCLAGAAVFANVSVDTIYYSTTTQGSVNCSVPFLGTVCPTGTGTQCMIEDDVDLWITKKVDGAACQLHRKPL